MKPETTCDILQSSEQVSDLRKSFICRQDDLHITMLESPWAILFYVAVVVFILVMVQRAANAPHRVK